MNSDTRSFEEDLSALKADVAVIRSNYATKADLQAVRMELKEEISKVRIEMADLRGELYKAINAQTWKLIGFISALIVASHFAARAGY